MSVTPNWLWGIAEQILPPRLFLRWLVIPSAKRSIRRMSTAMKGLRAADWALLDDAGEKLWMKLKPNGGPHHESHSQESEGLRR